MRIFTTPVLSASAACLLLLPLLLGAGGESASGGTKVDHVSAVTGQGSAVRFRTMTIAQDLEVDDRESWVEGGAEGSGYLIIRDPVTRKTQWVLLHGANLYLRVPGDARSKEVITNVPGEFVVSYRGNWDPSSKMKMNERRLSNYLVQFYQAHGLLHVPFLTGDGWGLAQGAPKAKAMELLNSMNLNARIMSAVTDGTVVDQIPKGGMPAKEGQTVMLWLDNKLPAIDLSLGDTHDTAIPVSNPGKAYAEISADFGDDANSPSCPPDGKDMFWMLPDSAKGRMVTADVLGLGPRVTLSAWKYNTSANQLESIGCEGETDCCDHGRNAKIKFTADATGVSYIMVDVDPGDLGHPEWITLELQWTPEQADQAPTE
jgi:hypothetical protein